MDKKIKLLIGFTASLIVIYLLFIIFRPIEDNIKNEAINRCLRFLPDRNYDLMSIEIDGDNSRAQFKIIFDSSGQGYECIIDWFNYISHGEYILVRINR